MKLVGSVLLLNGILLAACGDTSKSDRDVIYVDADGRVVEDEQRDIPASQSGDLNPDGSVKKPIEAPNSPAGTTLEGALVAIDALGLVQGWAVDKEDKATQIQLTFFIGDDLDTAEEIGTATADKSGFDNNYEGNHRFTYELPEAYRDGQAKKLLVLMSDNVQSGSLTAAAVAYTAYAPTAAGRDYYQNTLRGSLNQCQGCHPNEINYENHYRLMIDKSPAEGGSKTSNRLILKASGGLNHDGGNRCGGINNGACSQMQTWWDMEFN